MTNFKIINNADEIKLSNDWIDSEQFNEKGRTVAEGGKPITPGNYRGKQYRLISRKEYHFTSIERIGRGFLGVVAAVCTLGIAIQGKRIKNSP